MLVGLSVLVGVLVGVTVLVGVSVTVGVGVGEAQNPSIQLPNAVTTIDPSIV